MEPKSKKLHFCESNKCPLSVFFLVALVILVIACLTFFVPGLRISSKKEQRVTLEWWQKEIVYQIYPRSFQDSDGDGTGDIQGVISRLSYFNYLKVGAIWLSPFYKSPMRDFGYDVSNYFEVDPIFGNLTDFEELVAEAHRMGIKVIVDFVPNHTSNESDWFTRSRHSGPGDPYRDYYIWNPGKLFNGERVPPNNWQSVFGGPSWEWDDVRKEFYYHNYLTSQPDLNYRNTAVLGEMDNVLRFWLNKGVDGFRLDAVTHLFEEENQTLNETNTKYNGYNPDLHKLTKNRPEVFGVLKRWKEILNDYQARDGSPRVLIAETPGVSHETRMQYYEVGSVPFYYDLIPAKKRCGATAKCFHDLIRTGMNLTQGQWPNFVIGNHDSKRVADRVGPSYVNVMNMLLLTLPGTPTTYYGEELGMRNGDYRGLPPKDPKAITTNDTENSRDPERNPMLWDTSLNAGFTNGTPWLPITPNTDFLHTNVEVEKTLNTSSLTIYKSLADIRRRPAFQNSYIDFPDMATADVLVYLRGDDKDTYAIILNFGQGDNVVDIQGLVYTRGHVEVSTHQINNKDIGLSNIPLRKGEGLVIRLII